MDNTKQSPAILSLCTGMRGLERGLERACLRLNWPSPKTIAHVEIESFIAWNLVKQMEQGVLDPAPIHTNIKTFPWHILSGKVHGITGGYPCQPFSVAGKQLGTEDPRHLWPFIKEGIRAIRPIWCFFENVPGHLNIGYREVKQELEGLGYTVKEGIYSAEEVGAPHRRERLFILAIMSELDNRLKFSSPFVGDPTKPDKQWSGLCKESQERSIRRSSNELADSGHSEREGREQIKEGQQHRNWQPWSEPSPQSVLRRESILAYTNDEGLQGWNAGELQECSTKCTTRTSSAFEAKGVVSNSFGWRVSESGEELSSEQLGPNGNSRRTDRWPSRPNEPQYEWEPRRVESRVGYTLNGHNFREDLLRMVGNGVVKQTAEIAFIDLLKKHGII